MIVINNAAGGTSGTSDMPIGAIVLWYGTSATVPAGYVICNGSPGTPDLKGKFVRGASNDAQLLTGGGASTHLHAGAGSTPNGSHSHNWSFTLLGASFNYGSAGLSTYASEGHSHGTMNGSANEGNHDHPSTGSSGLSSSLPRCKLLYWIKRIS